ncbi:hypothetical protein FJTKL_01647 [Diaporthe vaccinii]|uniref:Uncharacterized protein n=1 Tax=Diaporthe vaccinii TaxID=105482 RepID=A0ABR4DZT8_9PEZI
MSQSVPEKQKEMKKTTPAQSDGDIWTALGMETPLSLPTLVSVRKKKRKHIEVGRCQAGAKQSNHAPPPRVSTPGSSPSAHRQPCTPPKADSGRRAPASQSRCTRGDPGVEEGGGEAQVEARFAKGEVNAVVRNVA